MFDQIMNGVIMVAGIGNAIIIAVQGLDLLKTRDSTGVSIKMFVFFIAFQAIFALNGWRLGDQWQMWGMILSIVSTIWVRSLTIRFRKPPYGRRMHPDTEI
ncbi:hypothetical protein HY631_03395 [Candidatus Uhrbacteria bacterium]|nr:hypothetical protein [Candidatus Uhrbacteria bacterium]